MKKPPVNCICEYCGKEYSSNKPASHVVPRMFFAEYKRAHGRPRFLSYMDAKPRQTDMKDYLLCPECEGIFSRYETKFAEEIKNPIYKGDCDRLQITKEVRWCTLSILWRILLSHVLKKEGGKGSNFVDEDYATLKKEADKWKSLLQDEDHRSIENMRMHIVPVDWIDKSPLVELWKKTPGFIAHASYHAQESDPGHGYHYVFCIVEKLMIFASIPPIFSNPKCCCLVNEEIEKNDKLLLLPGPIENALFSYFEDMEKTLRLYQAKRLGVKGKEQGDELLARANSAQGSSKPPSR